MVLKVSESYVVHVKVDDFSKGTHNYICSKGHKFPSIGLSLSEDNNKTNYCFICLRELLGDVGQIVGKTHIAVEL